MTDEQKVRDGFEAWLSKECPDASLARAGSAGSWRYIETFTAATWIAWQAAISHASATAEECSVGGDAVAWLEVEPGISFERAVSEHGMLIHSMQVHVGRRKPTKRQDANGLFPLFVHPPRAAEDALDIGTWLWCQLMAWCKSQGTPPAIHNKLFEIVERARNEFPAMKVAAEDARDARDAEAKLAAFRNRFISERTTTWLRDGLNYEMARAKAEADANEYEQAFDQAIAGKRGG